MRKKKGYSQKRMSKLLEIARTTYTGYETGKFAPSLDKSLKIKRILKYKKMIYLNLRNFFTQKRQKYTLRKMRNDKI